MDKKRRNGGETSLPMFPRALLNYARDQVNGRQPKWKEILPRVKKKIRRIEDW